MTYPKKIAAHAFDAFVRAATDESLAQGVAANFVCGSYVRFFVSIDDKGRIESVTLRSNGCGFMLASANMIANYVSGLDLRELHGSRGDTLRSIVAGEVGDIPEGREECVRSAVEALRSAFADLRARRVEEFRGEEALICTCFGVTEERIENILSTRTLTTVDEVTDACNAGGGCGSCRMLIHELLERPG